MLVELGCTGCGSSVLFGVSLFDPEAPCNNNRGVRHSFKKCTRFRNLLIFTERFLDFTRDFKISRKISRFHYRDFRISRKISGFQDRFQDFTGFHEISREISRLHERFRDCCEDFVNFHPEYLSVDFHKRFQAFTTVRGADFMAVSVCL